jgi:hypothetical protein
MSAACAGVIKYAVALMTMAAAAAIEDFTLTICFVLFSARPRARPSVVERSERCQEIVKRLLTLTLNRVC